MKSALQRVGADYAVSVSDLKKSPSAIFEGTNGMPVAVLNHNRIMAYMVPADTYEAMLERLDDLDLADLIRARSEEIPVPVELDDL